MKYSCFSQSEELGLNDHHNSLVLNYMRFAKFQRSQCLKAIENGFQDAKDTKLLDDTYTIEEVEDILKDINSMVGTEAETELLAAAHTNVLLLQQIFLQAQKWHLDLDADLSTLENRELLDKVKRWEDSELSSQGVEDRPSLVQKKLAPLNEGGPVQLLKAQIGQLEDENKMLRSRLKELEQKTITTLNEKQELIKQLDTKPEGHLQEVNVEDDRVDAKEIEEMAQAFKAVKTQLASELEMNAKTQKELEQDLSSTKHQLLDIQHQLNLAEKVHKLWGPDATFFNPVLSFYFQELERKFSQTGAYKNLKKMLTAKNDQIKELRQKLKKYEDVSDNE